MKTLLYGGSFDPPHNGYLNNLRAAAACVRPDRVVVMPAGLSPFKQHTAAPAALRLEMCGCFRQLAQGEEAVTPQLEVSSWEIAQAEAGRRNYTVLTLEMLAQNPEAVLYLAVGSDMLLSFDGWHRWQDILRLAHLVVTSRNAGDAPGCTPGQQLLDPSGGRILFCPGHGLPMASVPSASALPPGRTARRNCRKRCAPSSGGRICTKHRRKYQINGPQTGKELYAAA